LTAALAVFFCADHVAVFWSRMARGRRARRHLSRQLSGVKQTRPPLAVAAAFDPKRRILKPAVRFSPYFLEIWQHRYRPLIALAKFTPSYRPSEEHARCRGPPPIASAPRGCDVRPPIQKQNPQAGVRLGVSAFNKADPGARGHRGMVRARTMQRLAAQHRDPLSRFGATALHLGMFLFCQAGPPNLAASECPSISAAERSAAWRDPRSHLCAGPPRRPTGA
jgi:hypothetical protein